MAVAIQAGALPAETGNLARLPHPMGDRPDLLRADGGFAATLSPAG